MCDALHLVGDVVGEKVFVGGDDLRQHAIRQRRELVVEPGVVGAELHLIVPTRDTVGCVWCGGEM